MSIKYSFIVALAFTWGSLNANALNQDFINAVIGNVSFQNKFERLPAAADSEELRITVHLEYVLTLLGETEISHLSNKQQKNRALLLSHLRDYIDQRAFPKNYDYQNERRPTFIDKDGNICAVGYLVQQTAGKEAAETINNKYKYDYVLEMESDLLDSWLQEHGLSKLEAAMIQPAYGGFPPVQEQITDNDLRTDYIVSSLGLMTLQTAFSSISYMNKNSYKTNADLTVLSGGLGVASIALGLYNLNRSEESIPVCCTFNETVVVNESRRNLSYANIAFGSASVLLNTFRALKLYPLAKDERLSVNTAYEYVPNQSEPVPTLVLNVRL
ncbi:MAG: hypothetical protein MI700_07480 [Balneolales bacterium]|nr:hypothetical protein [Balneolales bacterium]